MDKTVKVLLKEEDVETLDIQAKEKGKPRLYLLREIIERHLAGAPEPHTAPSPVSIEDPGRVLTLTKALEDSQREREILQVRVSDLERALTDRTKDLEFTRGSYQALTNNMTELIRRVPEPRSLLEDRTSWWDRHFGKRPETPDQ